MDEHAALKRIFEAQALAKDRAQTCEEAHEVYKEAKAALDGANLQLVSVIEEYRTGQDTLPFEGAAGKIADDARMEDPGEATVPPAEAAKRRRREK